MKSFPISVAIDCLQCDVKYSLSSSSKDALKETHRFITEHEHVEPPLIITGGDLED